MVQTLLTPHSQIRFGDTEGLKDSGGLKFVSKDTSLVKSMEHRTKPQTFYVSGIDIYDSFPVPEGSRPTLPPFG